MRPPLPVIVAAALVSVAVTQDSDARADGFERSQRRFSRVDDAFDKHLASVQRDFEKAHAAWPPRGLYLRAFKREGELELWASGAKDDKRVKVRVFPICAASGELGPKVRQGDGQVPEGFYVIDRFNPKSSYHLSLGIDYPNAVDKARAGSASPGGDIFIHGSCVTIGCLPLEDGPVEALYVAVVRARDRGQSQIPVHIAPCRFDDAKCQAIVAGAEPELKAFWDVLAEGYRAFEATRLPPRVEVARSGYRFRPR